ncbi:Clp protease N-terminal domain-containing protein [Ammonicoccus fulvus]|uniref:Clp protease N-terminal domain-containing protein n=1 Tax=Ammonicoccus fulvus TaxID=3138240 RepID=A0ABZ3FPW1_9ACTN
MKKRVAGIVLTTVAVSGLGLGAAGVAFADPTATGTPSATASTGTDGQARQDTPGRGHHGRKGEAEMAAQLAQKLGVDEAKVTDALTAIRTERRAQAQNEQSTRPDRAAMEAEIAKGLASKLGVDEAKVTAALQEIRAANEAEHKAQFTSRLDQAVTDGKLTRAEGDAVLKAAEAGVIGMGGGGR